MSDQQRTWEEVIKAFAEAIGKSVDDVESGLEPLVGKPSPDGLALLENEGDTSLEELVNAVGDGVPVAKFRKAVNTILRVQVAKAAGSGALPPTFISTEAALPDAPAEEAWMQSLKASGDLKVEPVVVLSAIRTVLADDAGLYGVSVRVLEAMERHADSLSEPVGAQYFELEKLIVARRSAKLMNALGGNKKFATVKRQRALLAKLRGNFLPALREFYDVLSGWIDQWNTTMGSGMAIGVLMMQNNSNPGQMPPGFGHAPDTSGIRTSAETVAERINRVFAGLGIPVAQAMSVEAKSILEILDHKDLPQLTGNANKEQMLKELQIAVEPDFPRLERNLVKFALGVMEFKDVTSEREVAYLTQLYFLGQQISFDRFGTKSATRSKLSEPADLDDESDLDDDDELVGAASGNNGSWHS